MDFPKVPDDSNLLTFMPTQGVCPIVQNLNLYQDTWLRAGIVAIRTFSLGRQNWNERQTLPLVGSDPAQILVL